jgi:hypothetical protein
MKNKMIDYDGIISSLLASGEPSIRWKTRANVLGEDMSSPSMKELQEEIRESPRVRTLLKHFDKAGRLSYGGNVYEKWQGAHWVLASLADIGYPPGDEHLVPMKDRVFEFWLSDFFYTEFACDTKAKSYQHKGVPIMEGRYRRCAAQQGNALFVALKLGLNDSRTDRLVERLLHWQWPDGGWNCDRNPDASHSSFMETLIPLRGLSQYALRHNDPDVRKAIGSAAEVLLKRHLFRRVSNGKIINEDFMRLHYPLYWHYDVLGGLKVLAEAGFITDDRCRDSLDLLEEKALPGGGWAAEKRFYSISENFKAGADYVDWGGTGKNIFNAWVTVDVLYVLRKAGRYKYK